MWVTSGPLTRAYVSPVFLPGAGPCLECLVNQFKRISPAPEIYQHLIAHAAGNNVIEPVIIPDEATGLLEKLVVWKAGLLDAPEAPAVLYQLHALEIGTMTIEAHPVQIDPECDACQ